MKQVKPAKAEVDGYSGCLKNPSARIHNFSGRIILSGTIFGAIYARISCTIYGTINLTIHQYGGGLRPPSQQWGGRCCGIHNGDGEIDGSIYGPVYPAVNGSKNGAGNKGVTQIWGKGGKLPARVAPFGDTLLFLGKH